MAGYLKGYATGYAPVGYTTPGSLVGKRNLQPRGFITGNTSATYRLKYPVAVDAKNLKLTFPAWTTQAAGTGDTATGNVVNLGAVYVEYNGSLFPVTFNGGSSTYAIPSGGNITSDPVAGLVVTSGSSFYIRTYVTVASGGQWPSLYGAFIYPDEISRPGVNLANATGDLSGTGQGYGSAYGPVRVIGDVASPLYTISLAGDSILAGVNDSFSNEAQIGYWQRALYPGNRPYSIVALPSESSAQFLTQAAQRNNLIGDFAHYFVNQYGINDLQGGATLAQLQARSRQVALTTSNDTTVVKRFQQTLGPKTSSTDNWTTTANQTTDGINTVRVQFNDWVRDGMPEVNGVAVATGTVTALRAGQAGHPYSGYIEVADLCETARNSGIWKANYTNDGLHPGPTGNQNIAAALDLSPFSNTGPNALALSGSGSLTFNGSSGGGGGAKPTRDASSALIRSSSYQGAGASQAWASNTFSPPAGSVLVVNAGATQSYNNTWNLPTITDSLGTNLSWTRVRTQSDVTFAGAGSTVSLFVAVCPSAQTNMTVTVTQSVGGSGQTITFSSVAVDVWTNVDTSNPIGAIVSGYTAAQNLSVALNPTGSNSAGLIYAANAGASSATTTAGTGEYVYGETHTGTSFAQAWTGTSAGPTVPTSSGTMDVAGNAAARWQYIAYELNGTPVSSGSNFSGTLGLSGSGGLTFGPSAGFIGVLALNGSGQLTNTSTFGVVSTLALSGSGQLTTNSAVNAQGLLVLNGSGQLTNNGGISVSSILTLSGSGQLTTTSTISSSGTLSLAGSGQLATSSIAAFVGSVVLSGSGQLSSSSSITSRGSLALSGSGQLSSSSAPAFVNVLNLTGSGQLATSSQISGSSSLPLSGLGQLTTGAMTGYGGTLTLSGSGQLSTAPIVGYSGTLALSGSGQLSSSSSVAFTNNVALSGSGQLTTAPTVAFVGTLALSGSGQLTTSVSSRFINTLSLSGSGQLTNASSVSSVGVLLLSGAGQLTSASSAQLSNILLLSGSGELSTGYTVGAIDYIDLAGDGDLSFGSRITSSGAILLTGSGFLATSTSNSATASLQLTGSGQLATSNNITASGILILDGNGDLEFNASNEFDGAVDLSGVGQLTTTSALVFTGVIYLSGSGQLTTVSVLASTGVTNLTGSGKLAVVGSSLNTDTLNLAGSGTLSLSALLAVTGVLNLFGEGFIGSPGSGSPSGLLGLAGTGSLVVRSENYTGNVPLFGSGLLSLGVSVNLLSVVPLSGSGQLALANSDTVLYLGSDIVDVHSYSVVTITSNMPGVVLQQIAGPAVTLVSSDAYSTTFVAPTVRQPTTLTFSATYQGFTDTIDVFIDTHAWWNPAGVSEQPIKVVAV